MRTRYLLPLRFALSCGVLALLLAAPAAAQNFNSSFLAYVWANEPSTASYTPILAYTHNSTGGAVTITSGAAGTYSVRFAGQAGAATGSNVQVSTYSTPGHTCAVRNWVASGSDLLVNVLCHNLATGALADARYTVLVARAPAATPGLAYVWANDPTAASYTPEADYSFNGGGGGVTVTRAGTGTYRVRFAGRAASASGGHVQVTAYAVMPDFSEVRRACMVDEWGPVGADLEVSVFCFGAPGSPADARFTVLFLPSGSATSGMGFAWVNNATAASSTPPAAYTHAGGGTVAVTRSGPGLYSVAFNGVGAGPAGGHVQVTAYGRTAGGTLTTGHCQTTGWVRSGANFTASVQCELPVTWAPGDLRFTILALQAGVITAAEPEAGDAGAVRLHAVAPNPVAGAGTVRYDLRAPARVRLTLHDALGREVAVVEDAARPAGAHAVPLDVSALAPGAYVLRLSADGLRRTQRVTVAR